MSHITNLFVSSLTWIICSLSVLLLCLNVQQWRLSCGYCRVKAGKSISTQTSQSIKLVLVIISLYCLWCTSQIYWRNPPQPAVGEEADLWVLVFLSVYFFLPHSLCIMSMNPKEYLNTTGPLPLWWFHSNQFYNYLFSSCCRRKLCWVHPGLLTIVKLPL